MISILYNTDTTGHWTLDIRPSSSFVYILFIESIQLFAAKPNKPLLLLFFLFLKVFFLCSLRLKPKAFDFCFHCHQSDTRLYCKTMDVGFVYC